MVKRVGVTWSCSFANQGQIGEFLRLFAVALGRLLRPGGAGVAVLTMRVRGGRIESNTLEIIPGPGPDEDDDGIIPGVSE